MKILDFLHSRYEGNFHCRANVVNLIVNAPCNCVEATLKRVLTLCAFLD